MKHLVIIAVLVLVFVLTFLLRTTDRTLGPRSVEEVDDLQVRKAYYDPLKNCLILATPSRWARLNLSAISQTNRSFKYTPKPVDGNFIRWTAFKTGQPPVQQTSNTEEVAVVTNKDASFGIYPADGRAQNSSVGFALIPSGYNSALYRAAAEFAQDNYHWFKSYILVMPSRQPDGKYGVQFFYDPDSRRSYSLQPPNQFALLILGPSFVALCIALPLAFSKARGLITGILFALAFLLHGISSVIGFGATRYTEAWTGYSEGHNQPFNFLLVGSIVLAVLLGIKIVRATVELTD